MAAVAPANLNLQGYSSHVKISHDGTVEVELIPPPNSQPFKPIVSQAIEALEKNQVNTIDFSDQEQLTSAEIHAIAKAMNKNTSLLVLNLSNQNLDLFELGSLCEAITKNSSLKTLTLRKCDLNEHALCMIGQAIEQNTSILNLEIDQNPWERERDRKWEMIERKIKQYSTNLSEKDVSGKFEALRKRVHSSIPFKELTSGLDLNQMANVMVLTELVHLVSMIHALKSIDDALFLNHKPSLAERCIRILEKNN